MDGLNCNDVVMHNISGDEHVDRDQLTSEVETVQESGNSTEDKELIEDQQATEANLQLTGRPTSNVLQYEKLGA